MVSDHVYMELVALKNAEESFTKVIDRFIHRNENKKKLMDFAGAWSFLSEEEASDIKKGAKEATKHWGRTLKW